MTLSPVQLPFNRSVVGYGYNGVGGWSWGGIILVANKIRMQNLNKNGSFVQRRKMYVDFPFHNLSSKIPIDWSSEDLATLEKQRKIERERQEQEYIRKIYNNRIDQKLQEKFRIGGDGLRNSSQESSNRNGRDVLEQEVEHFNQSKVLAGTAARPNPEAMEYRKNEGAVLENYAANNQYDKPTQQYDKLNQPNDKPSQYDRQYERIGSQLQKQGNQYEKLDRSVNRDLPEDRGQDEQRYLSQSQNQEYRPNYEPLSYEPQSTPKNYQRDRYASQQSPGYKLPEGKRSDSTELKQQPLYMPKNYPYDFVKDYRRYVDLLPAVQNPDHPFRNVMPDKLENYLREKTKADRKSAIVPTLVTRRQLGY